LLVGSRPWLAGAYDPFGFKRKVILPTAGETRPGTRIAEPSAAYSIEG
jgi:hypothetical protein